MNKIFTILVFWVGLLCLGCDDDPQFPDPGFDMLTDKQLTVRRDTAESYTIHLKVNAPAGVQTIQLLNGRTYDLLEDLTEYRGKRYSILAMRSLLRESIKTVIPY